jgi:hypothetical protein
MGRIVAQLIVGMAISAIGMFGADSELGSWTFNPAKSTETNLKSRTEVIEATPDGWMKVTRTEQRTDGINRTFSFTFKYDGKEYPVTGGTFDTIAQERLDPNTTTFKVKRAVLQYQAAGRFTVCKDGKTRTQIDIPADPALEVGSGYDVTTPAVVIRPMFLFPENTWSHRDRPRFR